MRTPQSKARRPVSSRNDGRTMTGSLAARLRALQCAGATIAAGLTWRLAPLGIPAFPLKYGGSVLWGAMLFFLIAAASPRPGTRRIAAAALLAAAAIKATRLYHAPALDAFRATLPGALLLGRIFSPWDILAYAAGIAAAAVVRDGIDRSARRSRRLTGADAPPS